METKVCTKCGVEKELSEFYKKNTSIGTTSCCKECIKLKVKKYQENNKEKITHYKKEYYKKNIEHIKERDAKYYKDNKDIKKIYSKKYYKDNIEKILIQKKEYNKKYYKNNKTYILNKTRIYHIENYEKRKEYIRKRKKTEIGRLENINSSHKRRALVKNSDVTAKQLSELKQKSTNCYWCGISLKKVDVHIDHIYPLSKGGEHTISNLVCTCSTCNLKKNNKDPHEFAISLGRLL